MKTEFLQSQEWLQLQEATGKSIVSFNEGDFSVNSIVHTLPIVGRYLYTPRFPGSEISNLQSPISKLLEKAREQKCRWVRIEPKTEEMLEEIKKFLSYKVVHAPHDMQPREIFRIDITKTEEVLLAEMKPKTRYNIRLAQKRGVKVFETREEKYIDAFLDLITATSGRKGITSHPRSYYRQFFQTLPETMCRLFVAEYAGVVVASNIVLVYGGIATYLHGGTADVHRDVMAPYLLQWEQIQRARVLGCTEYDFGGVQIGMKYQVSSIKHSRTKQKDWEGITRFKTGFSPSTAPTIFPGSYDIVLDSAVYFLYDALRHIQKLKRFV